MPDRSAAATGQDPPQYRVPGIHERVN